MRNPKLTLLAIVAATAAEGLYANDLEEFADTTLLLREISVTAIKQSNDISLHPIASTLVGSGEIERLNIVSMKNVSEIAPNFYIPDYGTRMTSSIYVRGIGARIDQPVIGLNVDNVPFLNKDNYDFDLADIARIEVLRGPQSTLYGRNTMGGLVNIYTLSPFSWQGTRAMVEGGKGPFARASLSHYTRLARNLAMGFVAYGLYDHGIITNQHNGKPADSEKGFNLRWKTQWRPSNQVDVENTASFSLSRQSGYPYEYEGSGVVNYNDTCFYRRNSFADGLTVKYSGRDFIFSSITSFQYIDDNMTLDQDFLPVSYFTLTQRRHESALTQDFVFRGNAGKGYNWLGGVFGFYKHTDMSAPVTFKDYGISQLIESKRNNANPHYPVEWDTRSFVLGSDFTYPVYGLAAYHQSEYEIDRWKFAVGLRLDYEHASLDYHSHCNTGYTTYDRYTDPSNPTVFSHTTVDIDDTGNLHKSFVELLPKFTVSYRLPMPTPSNVYVSVGKGYKSGGFNTQMFSDVLQQRLMGIMGIGAQYDVNDIVGYKPEKSWNYELGAHIACADGHVVTDIATFYIDCRDQQLTMFPDGTTTGRITTNAGKTRSYGAEIQIRYIPTERWLFNVSYGYTNARFVEFDNGRENFKDKRVPYAPENTMFAGITYTQPVNRWIDRISFNTNIRGVGSIYWNEQNTSRQPLYIVAGASIHFGHKDWSLDLWGENLTDTKFHTFSFQSIGNTFLQRGKPLTWGATLRLAFGK